MAITTNPFDSAAGITYRTVTDDSTDWSGVSNDTYFFNLDDKLPYYKDSSGTVIAVYETGGGTAFGEPWGIFDSSGNVTTYATFLDAKTASSPGDTIHMFCNVTETADVTLDVSGVRVNFNGHSYILDVDSGSTAILCDSDNTFLYNGFIVRQGSSTPDTSALYLDNSFVELHGMFIGCSNIPSSPGGSSIAIEINNCELVIGKDCLLTSTEIAIKAISESNTKEVSGFYIFEGDIEADTVSLTDINARDSRAMVENCILKNVNLIYTGQISSVLDATNSSIYDSTFIYDGSINITQAIYCNASSMYNVKGIVNSGEGTGIEIVGFIGAGTSIIDSCYGEGIGDGRNGIIVKDADKLQLINCTGFGGRVSGINSNIGIFINTSTVELINCNASVNTSGASSIGFATDVSSNAQVIGMKINSANVGAFLQSNTSSYQDFTINSNGIDVAGVILDNSDISIRNFNIASNGIGINCFSTATDCNIINSTVTTRRDSASAHGIVLRNNCSVIQSFIRVRNTSSNCLNASSAVNAFIYQNFLTGATTKINANITLDTTATEDAQGNILL